MVQALAARPGPRHDRADPGHDRWPVGFTIDITLSPDLDHALSVQRRSPDRADGDGPSGLGRDRIALGLPDRVTDGSFTRYIILDLPGRRGPSSSRLAVRPSFVTEAMPVIQSFEFAPYGTDVLAFLRLT
jgi:hypothetical protein